MLFGNTLRLLLCLSSSWILAPTAQSAEPLHRADLEGIPVINVHTHPPHALGENSSFSVLDQDVKARLAAMDAANVRKTVLLCRGFETKEHPNLSHAGSERAAFHFLKAARERFVVFTSVDFRRMDSPDFTAQAIRHIEETVRAGARGLKFELGKPAWRWMPMDDPRLDPIYDKAGELGLPIMYHSSDPEEFFHPSNRFNYWLADKTIPVEMRYWEMRDRVPSREQLHRERDNMLRKHPNTTFILAHFGMLERQLALLADLLDRYPNVHLECSATLGDGARSPTEFAAFLTYYADRVMFGTDGGISPQSKEGWENSLRRYFTIFESDRHDVIGRARAAAWNVHGLNLSKEVMEKIYYKNAEKLLARPVNVPNAPR